MEYRTKKKSVFPVGKPYIIHYLLCALEEVFLHHVYHFKIINSELGR